MPPPANLFPPQAALLRLGYRESTEHWLICAPTGAGKTLMGEWALLAAIERGGRAAYLAPLKALLDERLTDWQARFPELSIGLFTGESRGDRQAKNPGDEQLLLFTPEKLAGYLQGWRRHLPWLSELDAVVVDEFHLVGDPNRGPGLEALLNRLQRINPFLRIVGLSATLANARDLADWLGAELFVTDWRPIAVAHRVRRFKRLADKPLVLVEEARATLESGGRVLVFVNSRRRAEALAHLLRESGLRADFHHAGLDRADRAKAQHALRAGEVDVLVATSTLEMGVNFPARKVVIYDTYAFDGDTFQPLSVRRFLQFAGRAGRAGYDTAGEAVLLAPCWDGEAARYLRAEPEPIRSGLFGTDALQREILAEVASRLSISEDHIELNFADRSLWRRQGGLKSCRLHLRHLVQAGLVAEREKADCTYLVPTPLGRIAAQMAVSPRTVALFADLHRHYPDPTEFDILLTACLAPEATPHLGFRFEEIDVLGDFLLTEPSDLLDAPPDRLFPVGHALTERRILSALKCACMLARHAEGDELEMLAEAHDCYPADLRTLQGNVAWLLQSAQRLFGALTTKPANPEDEVVTTTPHGERCRQVAVMIEHGIPPDAIGLVTIPGVGPRRARALVSKGIRTRESFIAAPVELLSKVLRLRPATVQKLLEVADRLPAGIPGLPPSKVTASTTKCGPRYLGWPPGVDPYRLRRALELRVDRLSPESAWVSGGTEPHHVEIVPNLDGVRYYCDCADFAKGHAGCKHVLRVRLERGDTEIAALLKDIQAKKARPLRYALGDLWMRAGRSYEAYRAPPETGGDPTHWVREPRVAGVR